MSGLPRPTPSYELLRLGGGIIILFIMILILYLLPGPSTTAAKVEPPCSKHFSTILPSAHVPLIHFQSFYFFSPLPSQFGMCLTIDHIFKTVSWEKLQNTLYRFLLASSTHPLSLSIWNLLAIESIFKTISTSSLFLLGVYRQICVQKNLTWWSTYHYK